jgi:hypothetical protein
VAVGKVTGTARRSGLIAALEAGAQVGQSFADFGYASTKNIPHGELEEIFHCMVDGLTAEAAGGYALLELADGFDQAETKAVLAMVAKQPMGQVVLCLSGDGEPADSVEQYRAFCAAHRAPDFISGCVAGQPDHVEALRKEAGATPLFNAMSADEHELHHLLVKTAQGTD